MNGIFEGQAPPIKIGGTWRTRGQGPANDPEVRVGYNMVRALSALDQYHRVSLREMRVSVIEDGYRVMLKGTRGGVHVVAFFHAETWGRVVVIALTSIDCGATVWHPDKYPPRHR